MSAIRPNANRPNVVWIRQGKFLVAVPSGEVDEDEIIDGPLEVHVSLTDACGVGCPACYLGATPNGATPSLTTILERLRTWAVPSRAGTASPRTVAFGGGEPLLRDDLREIAEYARSRGLLPVLTTSGFGFSEKHLDALATFAQVNLSHDGVEGGYEAVRGRDGARHVEKVTARLVQQGTAVGWNLVLTRRNLESLSKTFDRARELGVCSLQVLRVKPAGRANMLVYRDLRLTPEQGANLGANLTSLVRKGHESGGAAPSLRVDCALLPFLRDVAPAELFLATGVFGCEAGRNLKAVATDGQVYGCSFAAHTEGGDKGFAAFHEALPAPCNTCTMHEICRGGCRIIGEALGDPEARDIECPAVAAWLRESRTAP